MSTKQTDKNSKMEDFTLGDYFNGADALSAPGNPSLEFSSLPYSSESSLDHYATTAFSPLTGPFSCCSSAASTVTSMVDFGFSSSTSYFDSSDYLLAAGRPDLFSPASSSPALDQVPEHGSEQGRMDDYDNLLQQLGIVTPRTGSSSSEEPLLVNAKQYHRITKRRATRARLVETNKASVGSKPYKHESRHKHAVRRKRGPGGRFLTAEELRKSEELEKFSDSGSPDSINSFLLD